MENTSYIAMSRQSVMHRQMEILANNIANAATPSYKGEHLMFVEHLVRMEGAQQLSYVQDVAVVRDSSEGAFVSTGNPLDIAISGDGYLVVETTEGMRYTRNGRLHLDDQGRLVASDNFLVMGESNGPIQLSAEDSDVEIAMDGAISAQSGQIGQLKVVRFENAQTLRRTFGGLYTTDSQPLAAPDAKVVQGMIEESNVQPIVEMTNVINALRGYENTQKFIQTEHERQRKVIQALTQQAT